MLPISDSSLFQPYVPKDALDSEFVNPGIWFNARTVRLRHDTFPVALPITELAYVAPSIRQRKDTLPVECIIPEFTFVAPPVRPRKDALPVFLSIPVLADVTPSIGP